MNQLYKYIEWITWALPPPYVPEIFGYLHFVMAFFYVIILRYYIRKYVFVKNDDASIYRFAIYSWYLRILGGIFIYYFYLFYYGGGDVINYVRDSTSLFIFSTEHFFTFVKYVFYSIAHEDFAGYFFYDNEFYFKWTNLQLGMAYLLDFHSEMVSIFYYPFIFLGLGGYLPSLVVFNAVYVIVIAKFIKSYLQFNNSYLKTYHYLICNQPSILVWTSAPFKESFALLFMMYTAKNLFEEKVSLYKFFISIFAIYLSYLVKPYIGFTFLAIFVIVYMIKNRVLFSKNVFYMLLYNILFAILFLISIYFSMQLAQKTGKYGPDKVLDRAYLVYIDLQYNDTYYTQTGGSVYDLGPLEPTLSSFISKFPLATFTAVFRPFLTEGRKGVILLASLETTFLLFLFLYASIKYNIFKIIREIYNQKVLFYLFIFSIVLLFFIGLTSGNFGNLIRYRVPPYFFFWLIFFTAVQKLAYEASYRWRRQ